MERVAISSSLRFKDSIREAISGLEALRIEGLFPNLDSGLSKDDLTLKVMRQLEADHFDAINSADVLYVINPDGYIGNLVAVEIGYAVAKGKPVYFSEKANDLGLDALATGYIPMDKLEKFTTT